MCFFIANRTFWRNKIRSNILCREIDFMDRFDRAILEILQQDSTRPVADIAERIGLGT
ncbi:AsnC family protein, partial [Streptomyces sp. CHB19.2]|nr:AsnC family protein [Streptomyces sp. CHB19.2]